MDLENFVYLLCRFLGENRIYAVQCENSFTSGAHPRNRLFGLVIENRSRKDWHSDSFPQADSGCQPCGLQTAPLPGAQLVLAGRSRHASALNKNGPTLAAGPQEVLGDRVLQCPTVSCAPAD